MPTLADLRCAEPRWPAAIAELVDLIEQVHDIEADLEHRYLESAGSGVTSLD